MAVLQNECYRLVTIGYLKKFIGQSGSTSSIQNNSGGYATITRTDDTYCPTYSELTGGTIIQAWSQGSTPKSDRDGIAVKPSAILGSGYANNQCVDRNDLYLSITRMLPLSIKLGKYTFDACSGETNVSVSYSYVRTTKTMSGCATDESAITYSMSSTTVDAPCSELSLVKTLPNSASTITCTSYKMFPNNGSSERTDNITANVNFRGTTYSSSVTTNQPAAEGGYTHKLSEKDVPIDIRELQASPSNYRVEYKSTTPPGCEINYTVSLAGTGSYGHYITYAYEKCGVVNTADTIEVMVSTATTTIPTVSDTLVGHTDDCCQGDTLVDTKTLTLSWSGLSVSRDFVAICQRCDCPTPPPEPTKCCQLNGPMSINCSGEVQFEIGECGCKNMVDLGLSVKWGEYPMGTNENYEGVSFTEPWFAPTGFVFFQWGWTDKWATGGTSHIPYTGDIKTTTAAKSDTDVDDNLPASETRDAVKSNYQDSGYRMPTHDEVSELLDNTTHEWKTDYKGISKLNGYLLTSTKPGYTDKSIFLPAAGEFYPENETAGNPWVFRQATESVLIWTRTGYKIGDNNYSAWRIVHSPTQSLGVSESSRRYGNIVMPVCDRG